MRCGRASPVWDQATRGIANTSSESGSTLRDLLLHVVTFGPAGRCRVSPNIWWRRATLSARSELRATLGRAGCTAALDHQYPLSTTRLAQSPGVDEPRWDR